MSDGYFTLEEVRDADDIEEMDVTIPEWGSKKVRVRALDKAGQQHIRKQCRRQLPPDKAGIVRFEWDDEKLEIMTIVAQCVQPKFTEEDAAWLRNKHAVALDRIIGACNQLNGATKEARQDAGQTFLDGS